MKKSTWLLLCVMLSCSFTLPAQLINTNGNLTTNDTAPRPFNFPASAGSLVLQISGTLSTRPRAMAQKRTCARLIRRVLKTRFDDWRNPGEGGKDNNHEQEQERIEARKGRRLCS